jgi:HPt (histidine-containing phosphotransfer) domain-containing protein
MPERLMDVDPTVQNALRELMQEDYPLLLETFSKDAVARLSRLRTSLDTQDWDDFRQTAHSFKGSCGNMGALALQQACEEAECAALVKDVQAAHRSFDKIRQGFQRLAPQLVI